VTAHMRTLSPFIGAAIGGFIGYGIAYKGRRRTLVATVIVFAAIGLFFGWAFAPMGVGSILNHVPEAS
jgi:hypothetical protein